LFTFEQYPHSRYLYFYSHPTAYDDLREEEVTKKKERKQKRKREREREKNASLEPLQYYSF